jgi:lactoylglutathione lyase
MEQSNMQGSTIPDIIFGDITISHIHHIAIWTPNLGRLRDFYTHYFSARCGEKYENPAKGYASYFLYFDDGASIEIMHRLDIPASPLAPGQQAVGYTHLSLAVGSEAEVDRLAGLMVSEGYPLVDGPRRTGDGYYEAVVLDPDGNRLELNAAA